jgi:hypothetical protein
MPTPSGAGEHRKSIRDGLERSGAPIEVIGFAEGAGL